MWGIVPPKQRKTAGNRPPTGALTDHGLSNLKGSSQMNWDRVEGNWKQFAGKIKEKWGKLTEDDLQVIDGQQDQLVGRIQERYGVAKEEAQKQVKNWVGGL
jgi:uncharacterized protein YjbJ (UPF0337 family)